MNWPDNNLTPTLVQYVHRYDRGHISDEELIGAFHLYNPNANTEDIKDAWNSLIGKIHPNRFDMLDHLGEKFNLCILSNINNMHLEYIHTYLSQEYNINNFEERYFSYVFYSNLIGRRKPDYEIYNFVISQLNVLPENILFIDDLVENIDAARNNGWHGVVHDPKLEIIDKVTEYLKSAGFS